MKINVKGLDKVLSQFNGQTVRLKSDTPSAGWVSLSIGSNISYDFQLSEKQVRIHAPMIVNKDSLPKNSDVLREVIFLIAQLKDAGEPISLIEFKVGNTSSYQIIEDPERIGEYCIIFKD